MRNLDRELLHGNAETLVLARLAKGACHGYQIRRELDQRSRHYFQFAFGNLYPLLRGLERQRLATARWVKVGAARQRRQYALTPAGRRELQTRLRHWRRFAAAMERVLSARRSG